MRAPVAPNPAQEPSPEFQELMSRLRGAETQMPELPPVPREKPQQARSADNPMVNIITEAAAEVGVDPDFLIAKGFMESSLDPKARAKTSSARGLFQFTKGTWGDMVSKYGEKYNVSEKDINDPRAQAIMAAQYQIDNLESLKRRLGESVEPKPLDLYMTHFLGPSGGAEFIERALKNPNARAARDFKAAARRNKSIFFDEGGKARSYRDIAKLMRDKIENAKKETGIGALR